MLIHKCVLAVVVLLLFGLAAVFFGRELPSGFLPDEDQGYVFINLQLPLAASVQRTDQAAREVEAILAKTPGVEYTTSVIGFSLLSYVQTSYNAFFFATLKPWSTRTQARRAVPSDQAATQPGARAPASGHGLQLLAPGDPRGRHLRWLHIHTRRPRRS